MIPSESRAVLCPTTPMTVLPAARNTFQSSPRLTTLCPFLARWPESGVSGGKRFFTMASLMFRLFLFPRRCEWPLRAMNTSSDHDGRLLPTGRRCQGILGAAINYSWKDALDGRGERGIFLSFRNHRERKSIAFWSVQRGFLSRLDHWGDLFAAVDRANRPEIQYRHGSRGDSAPRARIRLNSKTEIPIVEKRIFLCYFIGLFQD